MGLANATAYKISETRTMYVPEGCEERRLPDPDISMEEQGWINSDQLLDILDSDDINDKGKEMRDGLLKELKVAIIAMTFILTIPQEELREKLENQ